MKTTIDIDIGGTFTDCFVSRGGKFFTTKAPTTPYNLSVGFMRAVRDAAKAMGISLDQLVSEAEMIRYSTTIALNTLIQRKGPALGLMVTEGHEDVLLVARGAQWSDGMTYREMRNVARAVKSEPLISRDMTVGIKERIDCNGKVIRPLDEDDLRQKLDYLVGKGAHGIVISLLWSYLNPVHEERIEEIIREEYPDSYLGSLPIVVSSKVLRKRFEYPRTNAAILNAYLHQAMSEELRGLGDELRDSGYRSPLFMVHNNSGMASIHRTTALQTYNGGPVAGLVGSAYIAKLHGYNNVINTDMGGTSFDLGLISGGSTRFYAFQPVIEKWQVDITMLETVSIGAGGGSIAWLNPAFGNRLEVGPRSAGSMPGPAAYDQGGTDATVTDADVVLGYINPHYYHGGRMVLNKEKAVKALRDNIARPMGIEVEEAAFMVRRIIDGTMGDIIFRETVLRGFNPGDFVLFAFGGAGPTHCCDYGLKAGIPKILIFPFSPVFCAFGSANMDAIRYFERSKRLNLLTPVTQAPLTDYDAFNSVVRDLQEEALKELALEGLPTSSLLFNLELDMKFGGQIHHLRIGSPRLFLENEEGVKAIYEQFAHDYAQVFSPYSVYPGWGVEIHNFALKATAPFAKLELPVHGFKGEIPPAGSLKGKREVYWEESGGFRPTNVYEQELLQCGNILEGPAVIEAEHTTVILPPGTKMTVNKYRSGEIEKI